MPALPHSPPVPPPLGYTDWKIELTKLIIETTKLVVRLNMMVERDMERDANRKKY